jgi:putative transposase
MDRRQRSSRRRAYNEPGHAHGLTFTCYKRYPFLAKEQTCQWLAGAIDRARRALEFSVWAYVFMPDHVHLIVFPRSRYSISAILKAIKEPVARRALSHLEAHAPEWLPRLEVRRGSKVEHRFWQAGGGYDRNITDARSLFAMIDYAHQNPVRKGLVPEAREWKWSSANWLYGDAKNTLKPDPVPVEWAQTE